MSVFRSGFRLRAALQRVAAHGFAFVPSALDERFRRRLQDEIDSGPFEHFQERFAQVRQQIDGFDVAAPFDGYPALSELCGELTDTVRIHGKGVRGLATWQVNEAGVARYRLGSVGITPHMDGRWYRRLVAVLTLYGRAPFAVCSDREGTVVAEWEAGPGDLTLIRGPGLVGVRDGRPLHTAGPPASGERCSLGLRMTTRRG